MRPEKDCKVWMANSRNTIALIMHTTVYIVYLIFFFVCDVFVFVSPYIMANIYCSCRLNASHMCAENMRICFQSLSLSYSPTYTYYHMQHIFWSWQFGRSNTTNKKKRGILFLAHINNCGDKRTKWLYVCSPLACQPYQMIRTENVPSNLNIYPYQIHFMIKQTRIIIERRMTTKVKRKREPDPCATTHTHTHTNGIPQE